MGSLGGTRRIGGDDQGRRSNLAVPMESNNTTRSLMLPHTCRHQERVESEESIESARRWKRETEFLVKQLSGMHVAKEKD